MLIPKAVLLYQPWGLFPETAAVSGELVTIGDNGGIVSEVGAKCAVESIGVVFGVVFSW